MMFSISMSCYENENSEFLHAVLLSILKQTVQPAQLVLVKNGYDSSDLDNVID